MAAKAQIFFPALVGLRFDGATLASGRLFFFEPGTTTQRDVFADRNKTTPATLYSEAEDETGPFYVRLGPEGKTEIFIDGVYDIVIKNSASVPKDTWENYEETARTDADIAAITVTNATNASNADTVDTFHASQTPGADEIPVLSDGNLKIDALNPVISNIPFWEARVFGSGDFNSWVEGKSVHLQGNVYWDSDTGQFRRLVNGYAGQMIVDETSNIFQVYTAGTSAAGEVIAFNGPYTVMHTGIDGHLSTFDADLLDGQHGAYYQPASDQRLKKNVVNLTNALALVSSLQGVRYEWNAKGKEFDSRGKNNEIGFIAQSVASVVPEAVYNWIAEDEDGKRYKTVDLMPIVSLLVEAVKELKARIEVLEAP